MIVALRFKNVSNSIDFGKSYLPSDHLTKTVFSDRFCLPVKIVWKNYNRDIFQTADHLSARWCHWTPVIHHFTSSCESGELEGSVKIWTDLVSDRQIVQMGNAVHCFFVLRREGFISMHNYASLAQNKTDHWTFCAEWQFRKVVRSISRVWVPNYEYANWTGCKWNPFIIMFSYECEHLKDKFSPNYSYYS